MRLYLKVETRRQDLIAAMLSRAFPGFTAHDAALPAFLQSLSGTAALQADRGGTLASHCGEAIGYSEQECLHRFTKNEPWIRFSLRKIGPGGWQVYVACDEADQQPLADALDALAELVGPTMVVKLGEEEDLTVEKARERVKIPA